MDFVQHWRLCATLLNQYSAYWQVAAFKLNDLSELAWTQTEPALAQALQALSDVELERLQGDDQALLDFLTPIWPQAQQISDLIQIPWADTDAATLSEARLKQLGQAIPGRKWQQLQAFSLALGAENSAKFVDCCCGKGHLSRFLAAHYQRPVLGLELEPNLVQQARQLTNKLSLAECRFEVCDVLSPALIAPIGESKQHLTALHACGYLHQRILQQAVEAQVPNLSLAPCCYHKFYPVGQNGYHFLSRLGQQEACGVLKQLSFEHIRSSVRQAVTINPRQRQQSQQLQAWRLGFDLIQRKVCARDAYLPVPSVSSKVLQQGFIAFVQHLAQLKQLKLPTGLDYPAYQRAGESKYRQVLRLDLMRMAFRRLLEVWLVLDQVCYLQEQGYRLQLNQFCQPQLSPRNLLINASLLRR